MKAAKEAFANFLKLQGYVSVFANRLSWMKYLEMRKGTAKIESLEQRINRAPKEWKEIGQIVAEIEGDIFVTTFGARQFRLS